MVASNHDNLLQSVDGYSNSLATHVMIIRSPLIVGRSLAAAGLKDVSAGSVITGLSVKLPDPAARVLELSYKAGSRDEAVRVVDSVIKSYDLFLQENYQQNSNDVLGLITKVRDELSADLKRLEKEYLEYRQKNTADPSGGEASRSSPGGSTSGTRPSARRCSGRSSSSASSSWDGTWPKTGRAST